MGFVERLSDDDDDAGRAERAAFDFGRFERAEQLVRTFGGEYPPEPEERCVKPFEGGEGCGFVRYHLSRKIVGPGECVLKVQPAGVEGAAAGQQEQERYAYLAAAQPEPDMTAFRQQIPCGQQDACGGRKQECRGRAVGFQKFEAFAFVRFPEKLDDGERKGRSETDQQKTFGQGEEAET